MLANEDDDLKSIGRTYLFIFTLIIWNPRLTTCVRLWNIVIELYIHISIIIITNGVPHTFSIFLYVLPYSKFKFLKLTLDQKQDTLFRCLFEAFQATGGIPKEIWFDNMSTVVDHKLSDFRHHRFNEKFLSFSYDADYHPIACRPFRPQTKGCVEALARTMGRLKPYNGEFKTISELNEIVNRICHRLNHEKSQGNNVSSQ